jgi:hypothetical protein
MIPYLSFVAVLVHPALMCLATHAAAAEGKRNAGNFVRSLWLVQSFGTMEAANPIDDERANDDALHELTTSFDRSTNATWLHEVMIKSPSIRDAQPPRSTQRSWAIVRVCFGIAQTTGAMTSLVCLVVTGASALTLTTCGVTFAFMGLSRLLWAGGDENFPLRWRWK